MDSSEDNHVFFGSIVPDTAFCRRALKKMARGRPAGSEVRQHIIEILNVIGKAHGYRIHKVHNEIFPACTRENIYYHLRKGVVLGEFVMEEIRQETGTFSWGGTAEKKYYSLGPKAYPKGDRRVKQYFQAYKK